MSLRIKAIREFTWILFEGLFSQGALFIIGIILARILSPQDFGLFGVINAILVVLNSIIEGGYLSALVRKDTVSKQDLSTIFILNTGVSLLIYFILFSFSDSISAFFDHNLLALYIKVVGIVLIINAMALINRVLLIRKLDFKTQSIISSVASILSGVIAVLAALLDYGIISLILLHILRPTIQCILLWVKSKWIPKPIFSKHSFYELSNFGIKLLIANLIHSIYKNGYYFIIGKVFNTVTLGFYTRAEQFQIPISNNVSNAVKRLSFPILSQFKNDSVQLRYKFRRFLRFSMFLNFNLMFILFAVSDTLIITLIGTKWTNSIYMLKILCIPGALYPLQILHLNLLLVKGYSNLNLRLEVIKKIILIPIVVVSIYFGITALLVGIALFALIEYFINSYYSKKIIDYSILEQFKDVFPFFSRACILCLGILSVGLLPFAPPTLLLLQMLAALLLFLVINELMELSEYKEAKSFLLDIPTKIKSIYERKN